MQAASWHADGNSFCHGHGIRFRRKPVNLPGMVQANPGLTFYEICSFFWLWLRAWLWPGAAAQITITME
jgi:hypothetical protein